MPSTPPQRESQRVRLGAHMSIAGGVDRAFHRALQAGCETMQIFTKSTNQWQARPLRPDEVARFHRQRRESGIWPVVAHDAYLINLASPDEALWRRSLEALLVEVQRCEALGIQQLVIHPGAHTGSGEAAGLRRIAGALDQIFAHTGNTSVEIVLETTAGQGTGLGHRFEHLAEIIGRCSHPDRLGVCFDTCHVLAAGYDIRTAAGCQATFRELDEVLGLDRLRVFHLNDSKRALGSRVDRHEHIGQGTLGLEPFRWILNAPLLQHLPMILETPKGPDMRQDRRNLAVLRSLLPTSQHRRVGRGDL